MKTWQQVWTGWVIKQSLRLSNITYDIYNDFISVIIISFFKQCESIERQGFVMIMFFLFR